MPVYTSDALILRTYKLGEADRIVVFLTRDRGKKRGVAKGARRAKSRYMGALEPMTRAGVAAMGLEVFSARPASGMTAVRVPDDVDAGQLLSRLEQRFGVKLASGQLELKGRIFRIAHFGLLDELDIIATLAAIELVLDDLGHAVTLGAAAAAASRALHEAGRPQAVASS